MIDAKLLRNSPDALRTAYTNRSGNYLPVLEEAIAVDAKYLAKLKDAETLRSERNKVSEEIGKAAREAKKAGGVDTASQVAALKAQAEQMKAKGESIETELKELEGRLRELVLSLPNPPDKGVTVGKTSEDNKEVRRWSEPRKFDFQAKDHHDLGHALGILDIEAAGRLSGSRFSLLKGKGARLERAIVQFMLDMAVSHGYLEVSPPLLVTGEILLGTGQLPKFEEDQYKTSDLTHYLIPTAEVPLTNLHRGEVLDEARLPIQYTAATPCFRREAGSYGKDTRGLIRNHQFNKVELVWLAKPEDSYAILEKLTNHAEAVLQRLGLPHRVLELCTGDVGFSSAKTYDLEIWMPGEVKWREVSSCSNCTDFQARRMDTRFKRGQGKPEFVHTLNGSGVAAGRVFAAVLENYQRADGSIEVPAALRPYAGFDEIRPA